MASVRLHMNRYRTRPSSADIRKLNDCYRQCDVGDLANLYNEVRRAAGQGIMNWSYINNVRDSDCRRRCEAQIRDPARYRTYTFNSRADAIRFRDRLIARSGTVGYVVRSADGRFNWIPIPLPDETAPAA